MPTPLGDFHHPDKLCDSNGFSEKFDRCVRDVEQGLPAKDAVKANFEVGQRCYDQWANWYVDDTEAGFDKTESNLILLFDTLVKIDAKLHLKLAKKAFAHVDEGNVEVLKFLLKTRYGYSEKTKTDVEISTVDAPVKFEIVDMTPNGEEEE